MLKTIVTNVLACYNVAKASNFFFSLSREFRRIVAFEVETEKLYLKFSKNEKQVEKKNHRH